VTEDRGKTLIRAGLGKGTTSQLAEKLELRLILGGAAVYRCGNCIVLNAASAAEVTVLDRKKAFSAAS
jgi:cytidylate kinase